ncbi:alpha/beta-hydrolase [Sarocladium strictum]
MPNTRPVYKETINLYRPAKYTNMVDFVELNGAKLANRIQGSEDAPLLITLHGGRGLGDHRSDFSVYSRLSDQFRVVSFDYRGHGQSSRTKPYTFAQLVDDIEALRVHFVGKDGKVVVCGGSFGGYLAQQYAITYPSTLSHLILRGTASSHHHEADAIKVLEKRAARAPSFSSDMLRNKVFGAYDSDLEFQLINFAMAPLYKEEFDPDAGLRNALTTVCVAESHNDLYSEGEKYFDYTERLCEVEAKTLVVVGEHDWICPPNHSRIIAEKIPGAELAVIPGANHAVHVEKTEIVLDLIRKFLS